MRKLLENCLPGSGVLAGVLEEVLSEGLSYSDGCVLLKSQLRVAGLNIRARFEDETGYECFVNHIHLEDLVLTSDRCLLFEQALLFGNEVAGLKSKIGVLEPLEFIIIEDGAEVSVRFHMVRMGQSWLSDNIEGYREAVAAIRS